MPEGNQPLAHPRFDAHDIELRGIEALGAPSVRKKSLPAERQLRLVAFDSLAFSIPIALRKLDPAKHPISGGAAVNDVGSDGRAWGGCMRVVRDGAMVGVQIEGRGAHDERRLNVADDASERLAQPNISLAGK